MTCTVGFRDPTLREHFVYWAYDEANTLLYIGCTKRPELRWSEHRTDHKWAERAARFRLRGPYNYTVGRQVERDAIRTEQPPYNYTPQRQSYEGKRRRLITREANRLMASDGATAPSEIPGALFYEYHHLATEWFRSRHHHSLAKACGIVDHYREHLEREELHLEVVAS